MGIRAALTGFDSVFFIVKNRARSCVMAITESTIRQCLKYLAEEQHTSEAEIYKNIQLCLDKAKRSPDPNTQAYWCSIPHAGKEPTVEEVLIYLAVQIKSSLS